MSETVFCITIDDIISPECRLKLRKKRTKEWKLFFEKWSQPINEDEPSIPIQSLEEYAQDDLECDDDDDDLDDSASDGGIEVITMSETDEDSNQGVSNFDLDQRSTEKKSNPQPTNVPIMTGPIIPKSEQSEVEMAIDKLCNSDYASKKPRLDDDNDSCDSTESGFMTGPSFPFSVMSGRSQIDESLSDDESLVSGCLSVSMFFPWDNQEDSCSSLESHFSPYKCTQDNMTLDESESDLESHFCED